jgi:hypothetical protein
MDPGKRLAKANSQTSTGTRIVPESRKFLSRILPHLPGAGSGRQPESRPRGAVVPQGGEQGQGGVALARERLRQRQGLCSVVLTIAC